jgi:hypothetical protein
MRRPPLIRVASALVITQSLAGNMPTVRCSQSRLVDVSSAPPRMSGADGAAERVNRLQP